LFFCAQANAGYAQAKEGGKTAGQTEEAKTEPKQGEEEHWKSPAQALTEAQEKHEDVHEEEPVSEELGPESEGKDRAMAQEEQGKLDIVLVLDNSGSMKKNDPEFLTREVVKNFLDGLGKNSRLAMIIFDKDAQLEQPLRELKDPEAGALFLESLERVNYKGQFTNSPAGIERAIYELKTNGREDAQRVIIFLTDGIVDTGDRAQDLEKERWLKEELALEGQYAGIRIFGVAFTDKADFRLIQTLSLKTGGEYYRAYHVEDIQDVFIKIKEEITKPPEKPEPAVVRAKPAAPAPSTVQEAAPVPAQPTKEPEPAAAKGEPVAPAQKPAQIQPKEEKRGIPLGIIFAGAGILLGIIIALFFILKHKPRPSEKAGVEAGGTGPDHHAPMPQAELIDVGAVISKETIVLKKREIKIGRDEHNDIEIPKDTVSSFHATIEYRDGYFYLEDQRSANGTSLNNKAIEPLKPVRLKSGDEIMFDVYKFKFLLPHQAPSGGTVLADQGRQPQGTGTVLRTPKEPPASPPEEKEKKAEPEPSEKMEPKDEPASPGKKESRAEADPPEKKEKEPEPPDEESKTKLKPGMCPNHPARKATELCSVCKRAFCTQCVTEIDGKTVCTECAKKQ